MTGYSIKDIEVLTAIDIIDDSIRSDRDVVKPILSFDLIAGKVVTDCDYIVAFSCIDVVD